MSSFAYGRGSKSLAGAASMKHRVPADGGAFSTMDIAQSVEQQPFKLSVAGSTPVIPANRCGNHL